MSDNENTENESTERAPWRNEDGSLKMDFLMDLATEDVNPSSCEAMVEAACRFLIRAELLMVVHTGFPQILARMAVAGLFKHHMEGLRSALDDVAVEHAGDELADEVEAHLRSQCN